MAYQRQPELNGAYYGPPIPPPPSKPYNHPRRGGSSTGCGCCLLDCLCNCGCCLLSCVLQILCSILVFIGLLILIVWLILRPHEIKFHATSANLSTFNLSSTTITYNLAVNFTVRNPNRRIGVYYDQIEANLIYANHRISTVNDGDKFYQGHKNTTSFGPVVFKGKNQALILDGNDQQTGDGIYDIVVKLNLKVRFKIGLFKFGSYKPKVKCDLQVPLEGKSKEKFQETRCHYYF